MSMIAPAIQAMIDRPGLYATYMKDQDGLAFVPVFSRDGQLWSLRLDSILDPTGFHENVLIQGPCTREMETGG